MLDQFRTQKLEWNRANNQIYDRVEANSGDSNGRTLFVQILNDGMVEDLTGAVLSLAWKKGIEQGLEAFEEVDAKKGQFRLFYPTGMLENHGVLQASLVLVDVTGRIESKPFDIIVHKGTVDDEAVESDNKFTALTTALVKVSQVQAEFDGLYADKSQMMDTLHDDKKADMETLEADYSNRANTLETTYAPRLTEAESEIDMARGGAQTLGERLDSEKAEVTAQLAQKATWSETRKSTDLQPINVSEMDTETKQLFTGGAVAVVGENAVGNENLKDSALSYSKQRVINFKDSENIFSGQFGDDWFDTVNSYLTNSTGGVSAIVKIKPQVVYEIKTTGVHNVFRVGFLNNIALGEPVYLYKNEVNVSRERKAFIRNENDYEYMIICLNSDTYGGGGTPQLSVKEMNSEKSYNRQVTEDASPYYVKEWINFETDSWASVADDRSVIYPILKNSTVKIQTVGAHNRFTIYTSKDSCRIGSSNPLHRVYVKEQTEGDEKYEFHNTEDDYVIIGIANNGSKPKVMITQEFPVISEAKEYDELISVSKKVLPTRKYKGTAIALIGSDYFITASHSQSFASLIKPNTHYKITVLGNNTDFLVATIDEEITPSLLLKGNFKITNMLNTEKTIREFDFVSNSTDVDLLIYLGSVGVTASVILEEVTTALKYPLEEISDGQERRQGHGITETKEIYPVMCAVKMSNGNDVSNGNPQIPRPVGWLYYNPSNSDIYYAHGSPDNMKFLCEWKKDVTWDKASDCSQYRPFITKKGDIVFVWRGDSLGLGTGIANVRQNPIVYPAGDWDNPVEVNLGSRIKPTAWLQNSGVDYVYNKNIFMFAEYTRPSHLSAYVWKVTEPITNPNNWKTVKEFSLSGDNYAGMKHCHTINYDPFSGRIFMTTGDDDSAAKVFASDDDGETWTEVLGGQNKYSRITNFIFTKDKVFYSTDQSHPHLFLSVDRDINGVPDFSTLSELYTFDYAITTKATYVNCFVEEHNGILMLDRFDAPTSEKLRVHFWEIDTNTMHIIKEIEHIGDADASFGFRVTAANFYPSKGDRKFVVGFDNPINNMALLGNAEETSNINRLNNLVLEVVKSANGYDLKVSAINKRT